MLPLTRRDAPAPTPQRIAASAAAWRTRGWSASPSELPEHSNRTGRPSSTTRGPCGPETIRMRWWSPSWSSSSRRSSRSSIESSLGRRRPGLRVAAGGTLRIASDDFRDQLDLNSDVERQLGHPDGGAGMAPRVAEDVHQQIAAAVDDAGRVVEAGRAVDHAEQLHDRGHAIQGAELGAQDGQQIRPPPPARVGDLGQGQVAPDLALPEPRRVPRALAGDVDEIAG